VFLTRNPPQADEEKQYVLRRRKKRESQKESDLDRRIKLLHNTVFTGVMTG
jgi:hypothetical protein